MCQFMIACHVLTIPCLHLASACEIILIFETEGSSPGSEVKTKPIILRDAFIPPSFDELDAVAVDSKGDPKLLHKDHLSSIREKGWVSHAKLFGFQRHSWVTPNMNTIFVTWHASNIIQTPDTPRWLGWSLRYSWALYSETKYSSNSIELKHLLINVCHRMIFYSETKLAACLFHLFLCIYVIWIYVTIVSFQTELINMLLIRYIYLHHIPTCCSRNL